ncbi:hypothetical protein C7S18_02270 [Ahniella affigens]|uniref:Uncharacterized protein n=1 Tax=Ahniella affigens TaxID=2021234 RepID=A0A2P1PMN3_9GAMM|nr:hypothetical protein [Ahniella affigens]AVP96089.1 hypothetical protein C7S18_02270 [Ahniella affigens]
MLRSLDPIQYRHWLRQVLNEADLYLAYSLVSEAAMFGDDPADLGSLVDHGQALSGAERSMVLRACRNDQVSRTIIQFRAKLHEREHRFFLALLLNVFDRDDLLAVVAREFKGADPVATLMRWMRELTGQTDRYPNLQ